MGPPPKALYLTFLASAQSLIEVIIMRIPASYVLREGSPLSLTRSHTSKTVAHGLAWCAEGSFPTAAQTMSRLSNSPCWAMCICNMMRHGHGHRVHYHEVHCISCLLHKSRLLEFLQTADR
ncbi:hypothetical protein T440DRAFT_41360 [Plenodomus tracheiphilus IPT5]|uniref:Uncharacterized protein n=1 Tax=Plenodomus tracheiphilus IPT5 TaxID=1408161 RepID=A0A6A7BDV0_9PLEO|nr:hypothetical protein T440DRAFT_41360 [Plenodomus tracheiphilus IPT5]